MRAHLRVGGGAVARLLDTVDVRRISAWAEEPNGASALQGAFAAHLRVGGGAEVSTSFR